MNKRELVEAVASDAGIEQGVAQAALDAVVGAISSALVKDDKVVIAGFGTFEVRARAARKGRNPQTGAPLDIPSSKAPAFKPAAALKQAVNGS